MALQKIPIGVNLPINKGVKFINDAIEAAERSETKSNQAVNTSNEAKQQSQNAETKADSVQEQFNQVVIDGDSSVEAAQARVTADGQSFSTLRDRLNSTDANLVQNMDLVTDYTLFPQSPKPEKSGVKVCSPKIIHKTTADELQIVQKTNKGYVHYTFAKNNGVSMEGRDYGVNHEMIRIIRARHVVDAYVYKDVSTPKVGTLSVYNNPSLKNSIEDILLHLPNVDTSKNISSRNGNGMGCYTISTMTEVTYEIAVTSSKKANALFMCSAGSANEVQILVNGKVVKTFNPQTFVTNGGSTSMAVIEFDIPSQGSGTNAVDITIKNNASSGNLYLCCLNFYELSDYNGQDISDYKAFGSTKQGWIESAGASDYALADGDGKWFGSYHGGEVSEYDRIYWDRGLLKNSEYAPSHISFSDIPIGEWRVQKNFEIYQQTSLADGKAKMVSKFDFNTDGTIEMDFGYYSGKVGLATFYTALTSTSPNFSYLMQPIFHFFGSTPSNTIYPFSLTEGRISQVSALDALQLDIRFTRFNNQHDTRGPAISDNTAYRKFYYGPIYGKQSSPVKLNSLSFSKGLDFIVR